jgi:hypothetical protein
MGRVVRGCDHCNRAAAELCQKKQAARFSGKGGRSYGEVVEEQAAEMKRLNDYLEKVGSSQRRAIFEDRDEAGGTREACNVTTMPLAAARRICRRMG